MRSLGRAVLAVAAAVTGIGVALPAVSHVAASGDDVVTLTIGVTQDVDSANVTVGYTVAAYEVWNLQYATLTDKAAADFSTVPGLAESWDVSDDGLVFTYHLRDGLEWSDGTPLTAHDVAYTVNRSRDEAWYNHFSVTQNLDAVALDDLTVQITSSVPDPKLPTMDVYIVPQHIYESISADDLATYDGMDGVGSGPFTLADHSPDQSWTMTVNPSYWGWEGGTPPIDQIIYRIFTNDDSKVEALKQGEIDVAFNLSADAFTRLEGEDDVVTVAGDQGGFVELAMNAGAGGIGDGHPALQDLNVRHAIARAINRDAIFERVGLGLGAVGTTISASADPSWLPEIPEADQLGYDPDEANRLLDEAGYLDTDDDGTRETPDGEPFVLRYAQRSESVLEPAIGQFVTAFLGEVGIATEVSVFDDSQLGEIVYEGDYDLFVWSWTPFVDPDPELSYFTCSQVTYDAAEPGYNDANWCDPHYDELYEQQKVELDPDRRREIVHEMITYFNTNGSYVVLLRDPDFQAYRTDRFEGWTQQPAETGPVVFTNSSPTYLNLRPIGEPDPTPSAG